MSIWNPILDLGVSAKDIPCNDMVMLDIVNGALNMTVCNRSNDVIWGAYGANAVQFSVLQEYIAAMVGVPVGVYVQQSNNYHVYTDNPFWLKFRDGQYEHGHVYNPYSVGTVAPWGMAVSPFDAGLLYQDCIQLAVTAECGDAITKTKFSSVYGDAVVGPVLQAYDFYKIGKYATALHVLDECAAADWRLAMQQWIERRAKRADDRKEVAL